MKTTFTLVALLMAGESMPTAGWTQVLTTGGTAGSSINDGANIGAGNHTGASVNFGNPEADQIRIRLGGSGQAAAKQNTIGQLRQAETISTTGASANNFSNPEADQIRTRLGGSGQAVAKQNTVGQLRQAGAVSTDNVTTTPAMMGATGSVHGNTTTAAQVWGAATVADILPRGSASYTYYPDAQVYFAPTTNTYYYSQKGRWYSSTSLPAGVKLGSSRTVQLKGNGAASVTTP